MNALALDEAREALPAAPVPFSRRMANVFRLHLANPWPTVGMPWMVLMAIFAMTYLIWQLVAANADPAAMEGDEFTINGGMGWILVYMVVVAAQAMNQSFSFGLGMSMTRRDYYVGTIAYCTSLAVYYATGLTVLMAVERATGGWGLGGMFFQPFGIEGGEVGHYALGYLVSMIAMFAIGVSYGAVFARWRGTGVTVAIILSVAALIAVAWIISKLEAWESVVGWFQDAGPWLISGVVLVPVVLALVAGYLVLRRTAPRA